LTFWPWKWCPSHVWRGLPLWQWVNMKWIARCIADYTERRDRERLALSLSLPLSLSLSGSIPALICNFAHFVIREHFYWKNIAICLIHFFSLLGRVGSGSSWGGRKPEHGRKDWDALPFTSMRYPFRGNIFLPTAVRICVLVHCHVVISRSVCHLSCMVRAD